MFVNLPRIRIPYGLTFIIYNTGVLISPQPDQEGNKLRSMPGTRAISTTSSRELSSIFFFFLQGKAPKEIHAILTEILGCFFPGRVKDLSAPMYLPLSEEERALSSSSPQPPTKKNTCAKVVQLSVGRDITQEQGYCGNPFLRSF